jgi:hypothetical protein
MSLDRLAEDGSRNAALQMHLIAQKNLSRETILLLTALMHK